MRLWRRGFGCRCRGHGQQATRGTLQGRPTDGRPCLTSSGFNPAAASHPATGEPLDIANWYYTGKHLDSGGYADGIVDEAADDNRRRPGRYVLFQRIEGVAFEGRAQESSLDKARRLSRALGTKKEFASLQTWQEWLAQ